jgi:hypothetical protein
MGRPLVLAVDGSVAVMVEVEEEMEEEDAAEEMEVVAVEVEGLVRCGYERA